MEAVSSITWRIDCCEKKITEDPEEQNARYEEVQKYLAPIHIIVAATQAAAQNRSDWQLYIVT